MPTGQPQAVAVAALIAASIIATRVFNIQAAGAWLLPTAGIIAAVGFGNRCRRVHPDEPWLPRLLLIGTLAKIGASFARYVTLTTAYENAGDATTWDTFARKLVAGWEGQRATPDLPNLQQSNFMKWITGVTYYLFGESLVGAFLLFGLLAVIGSYCWYRALSDAVPFVNKKLFLMFMMFAPSILFWPSSLGKEALMQLGVGAVAWATSLALNGRFVRGIPLMLSGGWLLFIVRPHLLALVTLAAAVPYFLGRVGAGQRGSVMSRPIGMIAIAILVVFTVTSGAKFLGLQNLSVESVQTELDSTTASTAQGGSKFAHGSNTLSPLALPNDVAHRAVPTVHLGGAQRPAAARGARGHGHDRPHRLPVGVDPDRVRAMSTMALPPVPLDPFDAVLACSSLPSPTSGC